MIVEDTAHEEPPLVRDDDEDGYGSEDHPSHYPKPGQGLQRTLPPEQEDLQWLVDDNYEVFTHIYQTDAQAANTGMGVGPAPGISGSGDRALDTSGIGGTGSGAIG